MGTSARTILRRLLRTMPKTLDLNCLPPKRQIAFFDLKVQQAVQAYQCRHRPVSELLNVSIVLCPTTGIGETSVDNHPLSPWNLEAEVSEELHWK